jgi:GrpB-like predicted nucleotidyltransferase (UPF0157 family)
MINDFCKRKDVLLHVTGEWCCGAIKQAGGTLVPVCTAKPIIDIKLGTESLGASKPAFDA